MKHFTLHQQADNQAQEISNPFIYTTPEVEQQLTYGILSKVANLLAGTTVASILTAPLQTVVSSMQLSVLPHKEIFASAEARSKQLAKMNTQLTIAQKRRLQLMIRSGGQFQPYVAPVYEGYQQAIRNIAKQGWRAFFKGLMFRVGHTVPHYLCYSMLFKDILSSQSSSFGFFSLILKCYGVLYLTDLSMNLFQVLENRYILQNNIHEFRVFRNIFRVIGKMVTRGELFKGASYHGINTFIELSLRMPILFVLFTLEKLTPTILGLYLLAQTVTYPFQTAYKRIICQSSAIPGMIPVRYSGIWHALKVITFEEKLKGLYRGFGLHSIGVTTRLLIITAIMKNVSFVQKGEF